MGVGPGRCRLLRTRFPATSVHSPSRKLTPYLCLTAYSSYTAKNREPRGCPAFWRPRSRIPQAVDIKHHLQLGRRRHAGSRTAPGRFAHPRPAPGGGLRSEEHTSELQSRQYLVCRLLLEKKTSHNYINDNISYSVISV